MLIVLSMHRSGSSLLAGILHDNGYSAGGDSSLISGDEHNKTGYFERRDVVDFNESLLKSEPFSSSLPNTKATLQANSLQKKKINELCRGLKKDQVRVLKDPRFCLTLPIWSPFLEDIKVVFLYRHPLDVAESYVRRQRYPFNGALALWEYYNIQGLNGSNVCKRSVLFFDDLISNPLKEVKRLNQELDLGIDDKNINISMADKSLVHGAETSRELTSLTMSQLTLFERLSKNDINGKIDFSESLISSLSILTDFAEKGFDAGTGKMVDATTSEKMKAMTERNTSLRKQVRHLERVTSRKTDELDISIQQLGIQKEKLCEQSSMLLSRESQLLECEENIVDLKKELGLIASLYNTVCDSIFGQLVVRGVKIIAVFRPRAPLGRLFQKLNSINASPEKTDE